MHLADVLCRYVGRVLTGAEVVDGVAAAVAYTLAPFDDAHGCPNIRRCLPVAIRAEQLELVMLAQPSM